MAQLSFDFRLPEKEEGERRLFFAFTFVILIASFVLAHLITRNMLWKMLADEQASEMLGPKEQEKFTKFS